MVERTEQSGLVKTRRLITGLERDTALVLAGTTLANLGAYGYHVVMSRHLGPTAYGALAAVLGIGVVVAIPTAALQLVVARSVASRSEAEGRQVTGSVLRLGGLAGLVAAALIAVTSPLLSAYLRTGTGPILWAAVWMVPTGATPALLGYLQGRRRFGAMTLALVVSGAGRALVAVPFVVVGVGVTGAVAVMAIATAGGLVVAALACGQAARPLAERAPLSEIGRTIVPLVGLSLIAGMDVVFARHYLAPHQAGFYAAASVAGKIVLWAPAAVTLAAFPAFAERPGAQSVLLRAMGLTGTICAAAVLATVVLKDQLIGGIFGSDFLPASDTVFVVAAAMSALTILQIVTMWAVARRSYFVGPALLAGATAIAGLLAVFHGSPGVIAVDLLIGITTLLAVVFTVAVRIGPSPVAADPEVTTG